MFIAELIKQQGYLGCPFIGYILQIIQFMLKTYRIQG